MVKGDFSAGRRLRDDVHDAGYLRQVNDAAGDLTRLFARNRIETDLFDLRMTITMGDTVGLVSDTDCRALLDGAGVSIEDDTSAWLRIDQGTDTWQALYRYFNRMGIQWVDDLQEVVGRITEGVAIDHQMALTSFESNGTVFSPGDFQGAPA